MPPYSDTSPAPLPVSRDAVTPRSTDAPLDARELLIAKQAAAIAIKDMTENFYKEVGRTLINKILIVIGALAVGALWGKGWLNSLFKG